MANTYAGHVKMLLISQSHINFRKTDGTYRQTDVQIPDHFFTVTTTDMTRVIMLLNCTIHSYQLCQNINTNVTC